MNQHQNEYLLVGSDSLLQEGSQLVKTSVGGRSGIFISIPLKLLLDQPVHQLRHSRHQELHLDGVVNVEVQDLLFNAVLCVLGELFDNPFERRRMSIHILLSEAFTYLLSVK